MLCVLIVSWALDEIKSLRFESWWVENREKNQITVIFRLDGKPHEVIIKDTKYYVKELYSGEKKKKGAVVTVSYFGCFKPLLQCWDLHVGCSLDIFGKPTIMKQSDLKTAEWNKFYGSFLSEVRTFFLTLVQMKNTFIDELRKYERKALDVKLTRSCEGKGQCTTNLQDLIG